MPPGDPRLLEALGHLFQNLEPYMAPVPLESFQDFADGGLSQALRQGPQPAAAPAQSVAALAPTVA